MEARRRGSKTGRAALPAGTESQSFEAEKPSSQQRCQVRRRGGCSRMNTTGNGGRFSWGLLAHRLGIRLACDLLFLPACLPRSSPPWSSSPPLPCHRLCSPSSVWQYQATLPRTDVDGRNWILRCAACSRQPCCSAPWRRSPSAAERPRSSPAIRRPSSPSTASPSAAVWPRCKRPDSREPCTCRRRRRMDEPRFSP